MREPSGESQIVKLSDALRHRGYHVEIRRDLPVPESQDAIARLPNTVPLSFGVHQKGGVEPRRRTGADRNSRPLLKGRHVLHRPRAYLRSGGPSSGFVRRTRIR